MDPLLFSGLSKAEKINFFVRCQSLLLKHHPDSEYIFTYENINHRKDFALKFIRKYKGYAYWDDNICILFNKTKTKDPQDPNQILKESLYQEPAADANTLIIDFVVFRKLEDCLNIYKSIYQPAFEYIVFVRSGQVKLYKAEKILKALNVPSFLLQGA